MTFAEFQKQAGEILKDVPEAYNVSIDYWYFRGRENPHELVSTIWVTEFNGHFKAPTPELALEKLSAFVKAKAAKPPTLDSVGEVSVAQEKPTGMEEAEHEIEQPNGDHKLYQLFGEFTPGEAKTYDHPGCEPDVEINSIWFEDDEIHMADWAEIGFSQDIIVQIEGEMVDARLEADRDAKEDAAEMKADDQRENEREREADERAPIFP